MQVDCEGSAKATDRRNEAPAWTGSYFEIQRSEHFELLDFVADPSRCPQSVAVLRRCG